jgi:hypothetical protein
MRWQKLIKASVKLRRFNFDSNTRPGPCVRGKAKQAPVCRFFLGPSQKSDRMTDVLLWVVSLA